MNSEEKKAKKKYIVEDKINKYYISKDKIREKIKELEQIKNTALTERTVEMMEDKINILNLVLEENK